MSKGDQSVVLRVSDQGTHAAFPLCPDSYILAAVDEELFCDQPGGAVDVGDVLASLHTAAVQETANTFSQAYPFFFCPCWTTPHTGGGIPQDKLESALDYTFTTAEDPKDVQFSYVSEYARDSHGRGC